MSCKHYVFSLIILFSLILSGCSALAAPKQIAAYPRTTPVPIYPGTTVVVYHAYLELKVWDVEQAANRATQMTYDNGGYLSSSQSWYVDGRKVTTLELAVPTFNFDSLRRTLLSLGDLISENISGELVDPHEYYGYTQYSQITLQLRPDGINLPPVEPPSTWRPLNTLQNAFSVTSAIFGFLFDILIWVIVVGGPFLLIALGIRWAIRHSRPTHSP
jgi:hypothetical protein